MCDDLPEALALLLTLRAARDEQRYVLVSFSRALPPKAGGLRGKAHDSVMPRLRARRGYERMVALANACSKAARMVALVFSLMNFPAEKSLTTLACLGEQ